MQDPLPDVERAFTGKGLAVTVFHRRALQGRRASAWPPPGPFGLVALRLPRGKEELSMSLSSASSVIKNRGTILIYGANDEGIQTAEPTLARFFSRTETLAVGGRCRVLKGVGVSAECPHPSTLGDWKTSTYPDYPELSKRWVSYPGVFAHGRLDGGTRLLLDCLPALPPGARILDYGCGTGVIGYVARWRGEGVRVDLLDVDAVALEAARENVPGGTLLLRDGLPPPGFGPYQAILSNPPFHRGKAEDPEMIVSLISGAPGLLERNGMLVFVAQRRLPLERELLRSFRRAEVLGDDRVFRVWQGREPRRDGFRKR